MPACAIRYRLDGSGPATYLVDCEGEYRIYARGALGGAVSQAQLLGLLASRGCRWVPASGELPLPRREAPRPEEMVVPFVGAAAVEVTAPV
jgi:hypothetical protein